MPHVVRGRDRLATYALYPALPRGLIAYKMRVARALGMITRLGFYAFALLIYTYTLIRVRVSD